MRERAQLGLEWLMVAGWRLAARLHFWRIVQIPVETALCDAFMIKAWPGSLHLK